MNLIKKLMGYFVVTVLSILIITIGFIPMLVLSVIDMLINLTKDGFSNKINNEDLLSFILVVFVIYLLI